MRDSLFPLSSRPPSRLFSFFSRLSLASCDKLSDDARLFESLCCCADLLVLCPSFARCQDVISRIQSLEAAGRLTGVLDDRGKFLSITPSELDQVAAWINKRGRVSIAEMVAESNRLIDLNGTADDENQEALVIDDDDAEQKK